MTKMPQARQDRLVIQELPTEVLVYDLDRDKAHCLNQSSAFIWRQCDGQTTLAEARSRFEAQFKTAADDSMIWLALDQLDKFNLLDGPVKRPAGLSRVSRRAVIQSMGLAAVVAVPLITSIVAPTVQAVNSCAKVGDPCQGNGNCCSGNCVPTGGGICQP
ncbi:MAG: hypothetical protein QOD75_3117 [Blastocatellia bacterium]|jgi:hypothetical protein|nr:hypothetical protein [Blastocatellia bacterium]